MRRILRSQPLLDDRDPPCRQVRPGVSSGWSGAERALQYSSSPGEPASKDFNVPGNVVGNFSFDAVQPGNWTYRCGIHPTTMNGTIQILEQARPVNLTLYGDAALGWGFSNATIREPGPPIVVLYNTNVKLTLIAKDSAPHNWFIDYNNDLTMSPEEPSSKDFNVPGHG